MASNSEYTIDHGEQRDKHTSGSQQHLRLGQLCRVQLFTVLVFAVGVTGGILIGIYAYHANDEAPILRCEPETSQNGGLHQGSTHALPPRTQKTPVTNTHHAPVCDNHNPIEDENYENYIYSPLTMKEMNEAATFFSDQGIISTLSPPTDLRQNFIRYISLQYPNKAEALRYLDDGGPKPGRYAHVTVQRGGIATPDVMEYSVGPLGSGAPIAYKELLQPGEVHFNARAYEYLESEAMTALLEPDLQILEPLMKESFDGAIYPDQLFVNFYNGPPGLHAEDRETRWLMGFKGLGSVEDVDLIHLLPLSGSIHNPGTNTSDWYTYDFHYLNQGPFRTSIELMDAYQRGAIRKVALSKGYKDTVPGRIFPKRDQSLPLRENADKPGTRSYYPSGPRYKIRGTNVRWMGWNFYLSGGQIRGPAIFNIKFRGERIAYELATNDIELSYAMDSHAQNNIIYADATYGIMGGDWESINMVGVDCPEHGTLLNTSYWWSVTQKAYDQASICVFEKDGEEPLWRHRAWHFEAGMRNRYLVVRVPVVIGNYDYIFEFNFYLDGKIFTKVLASGYIQTTFWDENNPNAKESSRNAFGYRVSDYHAGPIHDHMFGFKVDLDIVDKNNTFKIIKWKQGSALEALQSQRPDITESPSYFIYNETRYIEWKTVEHEMGIRNQPEQQFWVVANDRNKNKWGVERGYAIVPMVTGTESLTSDHPMFNALSYTKYHCAVTKRKEDEPFISSIYDVNRMATPKNHLDTQLDNEYIVDDDIVTWVTIGFLHIPTSEDMPMTVRVESSFLLKPFNFFDRTATFDMPQHTETENGLLTESEPDYESCVEPKTKHCRFC